MAKPTVAYAGDAAPLPGFVAGQAAGARWAQHKPRARPHCDVCTWQCHHGAMSPPPRRGAWKRTGLHGGLLAGQPATADVFLCTPHAAAWRELDDAAKDAAKEGSR